MFRRLALALGIASATGGASSANASASSSAPIPADLPQSEAEWKSKLSQESFYVLRKHGTERPFTSPLNNEKRKGTFVCAGCGTRLFSSSAKFDSGTGWPSFFAPLTTDGTSVESSVDKSIPFMTREEIHCAKCKGHLGHVFPDGPRPTGLRYCMNGVSLEFVPEA
jgi:peptide-methionine (R)-S-oxide reductase